MKKISFLLSIISVFLLTGCDQTTSTIGGAAIGTAVGAGIGNAIGGSGGATALGAVLGGLGGAAIGSNEGAKNNRAQAAPSRPSRVYEERRVYTQERRPTRHYREERHYDRYGRCDYVEEYEEEHYY